MKPRRRPSFAAQLALAQRNAEACESAWSDRCRCHCGGAAHGKAHDAGETRRAATKAYARELELYDQERREAAIAAGTPLFDQEESDA